MKWYDIISNSFTKDIHRQSLIVEKQFKPNLKIKTNIYDLGCDLNCLEKVVHNAFIVVQQITIFSIKHIFLHPVHLTLKIKYFSETNSTLVQLNCKTYFEFSLFSWAGLLVLSLCTTWSPHPPVSVPKCLQDFY